MVWTRYLALLMVTHDHVGQYKVMRVFSSMHHCNVYDVDITSSHHADTKGQGFSLKHYSG